MTGFTLEMIKVVFLGNVSRSFVIKYETSVFFSSCPIDHLHSMRWNCIDFTLQPISPWTFYKDDIEPCVENHTDGDDLTFDVEVVQRHRSEAVQPSIMLDGKALFTNTG